MKTLKDIKREKSYWIDALVSCLKTGDRNEHFMFCLGMLNGILYCLNEKQVHSDSNNDEIMFLLMDLVK